MISLLKIDFRKYFFSKVFWILLSIYLALIVIVFFSSEKMLNNVIVEAGKGAPVTVPNFSLYSLPLVWHNLTFVGGFFKIFLALIVLTFITNEFSHKTVRQNVMLGMSRGQFLFSKVLFVFNLSLISTLILFVSGAILGITHTENMTVALFFEKIEFLPAYFLELFTFCSLSLMLAFLIQRSGLSIGLLALYYYIVEPIAGRMLPDQVSNYLPVESMGNLIDIPNSSLMKMFGVNFREFISVPDVYICLVYSAVFIGITFLVINRKDL
jgi:ABC-2 type transport system permease protein